MRAWVPILIFPALALPPARAQAPRALLWTPPAQAGGATDSARALERSLERLGLAVAREESLAGRELAGFDLVLAVLGTFPRKHVPAPEEAAALAAFLRGGSGALYLEGGDAFSDLPPELAAILGVRLQGDGAGDLARIAGLDAAPGPALTDFGAEYEGENRSMDRLGPEGVGAHALLLNPYTGSVHAVFRGPPSGGRSIAASFEFGGVAGDPDPLLRSCLIGLGVLPECARAVEGLPAGAFAGRVRLRWRNRADYTGLRVRRAGREWLLPAGSVSFADEPGPGEHRYEVSGLLEACETAPAFFAATVLEGAHLVWRPPETLAGPVDSAREIRAALEANGRATVTVGTLAGLDLRLFRGLWAALGTYPYHHALSPAEGQLLADYLSGGAGPPGARLSIEGGDIWGEDPPTALRQLDGVKPVASAPARRLRYLRGLDSGAGLDLSKLVRLPVDYTAETEALDVIAADAAAAGAGAAWVDDLSGEVVGVYRRDPAGRFALLSTSFEFGGVTSTREERVLLMELYLTKLELPPPGAAPRFLRGDADGNGALALNDPIQILGRLFLGGALEQDCEDAADADDDGALSVTDPVVVLTHLFLGGPPPAPPGACGPDPTPEDALAECRPVAGGCA